jgi:acetyl-CoA carboxylase biotin carboxyl carrier protein
LNTKDIEQLIKLLEESTISEIEIGKWGRKIRVSRQNGQMMVQGSGIMPQTVSPLPTPEGTVMDSPEAPPVAGVAIKSPMVGTFYRSPSPETDSFVKVGDHVSKGDTLCIIEAMKIMNEVEAEISGVILDIQVDNAQPVEYGQTLFMIEP